MSNEDESRSPLVRPECWTFAMDFLGQPEASEIETYVTSLEDKIRRLTELS